MSKKKPSKESSGDETQQTIEKQVRMVYRVPENQRYAFANNLVIQFDGDCFFITFLETPPPFIMGTPEQQQKQLAELESVPAFSVAKIVVPKAKMELFIDVLSNHFRENVQKVGDRDAADEKPAATNGGKNRL